MIAIWLIHGVLWLISLGWFLAASRGEGAKSVAAFSLCVVAFITAGAWFVSMEQGVPFMEYAGPFAAICLALALGRSASSVQRFCMFNVVLAISWNITFFYIVGSSEYAVASYWSEKGAAAVDQSRLRAMQKAWSTELVPGSYGERQLPTSSDATIAVGVRYHKQWHSRISRLSKVEHYPREVWFVGGDVPSNQLLLEFRDVPASPTNSGNSLSPVD